MNSKSVIQLLEKYWNCETSPEEERMLRVFFSGENVPADLQKYRSLFVWKNKQRKVKSEKNLLGNLKKPLVFRLYPILKSAAAVLLILTISISIYTHYQQEKMLDRIFSETYSNPEDALMETKKVIVKVSSVLDLKELNPEDSINSTSKIITE